MKKQHKTVLVIGNFDLLHPGHVRLLKFARECGDQLLVAVNKDCQMKIKSRVPEQHRLEMIQSLECVDEAFLTSDEPTELIARLKPAAVVKGKEYENRDNPELKSLSAYGGKLIFGSGEFETSAQNFVKRDKKRVLNLDYTEAAQYAKRHNISASSLSKVFKTMRTARVLVIGEIIVDEYVQGTAVGLSQEDPTIVITPNRKDTFLGGAAITAGHIKALGAEHVVLASVLGEDQTANYTRSQIANYQVEPLFFSDQSRPTPLKTRYRASNKTLLRVNQVRQHKISQELQAQIYQAIESQLNQIDLLVFSDFNYGLLPQPLVEKIAAACHLRGIRLVADSQTSSQVGDIARYCNMDLLTPTEREVRVSLNNPDDGLVILAQKLTEVSQPKNLVITLAEEGILIHKPNHTFDDWENDRLPALNTNAVDPAGAGDCFLAASSLALVAGANIWQACYLGSLAAACQVASLGNTPLSCQLLEQAVKDSFS
ncbi:ADP-heptose synthase [Pseudoalteromonas piscicida]|uniref:ADP-heptose synthase n=1 Tax=Pseudoalteromonas piscicida TaxID=43662 RepID=A0AAQ2EU02_PSEO7|nr:MULTISPECIES: PfkB family carbohydrate kinase [Pseudoalteromonas]TMN39607.1 ADP-heptose synthase [Pseudoalteromonas piscicida]TMN41022.1 ADP-heptose synthase [Pseudoalteromonas piscicida]TMN49431.1 ADP-heptose synthase [Pseudoalteromonas piscicida]TMN51532.1 ADP-heptose synthase [Pseudoalteromonas piscicida]TMN51633.1 ADP-heptose synthase [Pseudoalteromonas piscicida]